MGFLESKFCFLRRFLSPSGGLFCEGWFLDFLDFFNFVSWKVNLNSVASFFCVFLKCGLGIYFWVFNLAKALLRRKLIFGF